MKKKWIVGLAVSGVLLYLSLKGIHFASVAESFRTIRYSYLLPALALIVLMQFLRSYRWGLMLSPLAKIDQFSVFSVTCVGFLAIIAIPARLGELARPYLITKKSPLAMSAALGTIIAERILDSLTVLIIAVFVLFLIPLPTWLVRSSVLFLLLTLGLLAMIVFMILKRKTMVRVLAPLIARLPARHAERAEQLIHQFIDGFQIIVDPPLLFSVTGLSIAIWLVDVGAIYLMLLATGFQLPVAAAFVVMIILIIGIAIPTAPGFIGNWHYFCILGLSLFDVPKTDALAFAVIYHFLSIGVVIVLGLAFLPSSRLSMADLREQAKSAMSIKPV